MRALARIALFVILVTANGASHAGSGTEPQVYFFWRSDCPFSRAAHAFLLKAKSQDPRIKVREFDVEREPEGAILASKIFEDLGLPGVSFVPVVVVGRAAIVGYSSDEATGQEILQEIAACRKQGCPDPLANMIEKLEGFPPGASLVNSTIASCRRSVLRGQIALK